MLGFIVAFCSVILTVNYTSASPVNVIAAVVAIVGIFIFLAACVAFFGVCVRRLRDRGKSGFWIILYYVVPITMALLAIDPEGQGVALNWIALAILVWAILDLGILPGKPDDEVYGSVPVNGKIQNH